MELNQKRLLFQVAFQYVIFSFKSLPGGRFLTKTDQPV